MSNNNNVSPEATAGILILTGMIFMAVLLFYLALIFCIALTFVCIWAWNEERELFGQKITPLEARAFVICGIIGAIVVGVFGLILAQDNYAMKQNLGYFGYGGYILGSLGWAFAYGKQQERMEQEAAQRELLNSIHRPTPRDRAHHSGQHEPANSFQYASWDDEEPRH